MISILLCPCSWENRNEDSVALPQHFLSPRNTKLTMHTPTNGLSHIAPRTAVTRVPGFSLPEHIHVHSGDDIHTSKWVASMLRVQDQVRRLKFT